MEFRMQMFRYSSFSFKCFLDDDIVALLVKNAVNNFYDFALQGLTWNQAPCLIYSYVIFVRAKTAANQNAVAIVYCIMWENLSDQSEC